MHPEPKYKSFVNQILKEDRRVIKAGKCKARAVKAEYQHIVTKDGRELEFVNVTFKLENEEHIDWPAWFSDDQEKNSRSLSRLRLCGWEGNDVTDMSGIDKNQVQLDIEDHERNGKNGEKILFSRVRYVNELRKKNAVPDPEKAADLSSRIKAISQGSPGGEGKATNSFDSEDDIPF